MFSIRKFMFLSSGLFLVVACTSTPPTVAEESGEADEANYNYEYVFAEVEGLDQDERWDRLVELAEAEEGTFMAYLSVGADDAVVLMEGFETTIDSDQIETDYWRGGGTDILQRITQEHDAGRPQNDVVFESQLHLTQYDDAGLIQHFDTPLRDQILDSAQADYGLGVYVNVNVPVWNTDLVDGAAEFETWLDIVTHDGPIGVVLDGEGTLAELAWYFEEEYGMSVEETVQLFEDATLRPVDGRTALVEFTAAGEVDVALSLYSHYFVGPLADAPIEFRGGPEPFFVRWNGVSPMASSDMPATALLFIDYAASVSGGQKIMQELGREPANVEVEGSLPEIHDYEWRPMNDSRVAEEREMWVELWYERILGQARPSD